MLKKIIPYTDYNGNHREEECYFNISKAELMEMDMSADGGLEAYIRRIVSTQDSRMIMQTFKDIIMKSYGIKSLDGRRIQKSDELSKEFTETEAYSELLMELLSDEKKAADFIKAILPDVEDEHKAQIKAVPAPSAN